MANIFRSYKQAKKERKEANRNLKFLRDAFIDDYLQRWLFQNDKYKDPKKLSRFDRQVFSQNGEDGIIEEIFKRIGTTNKYFAEFGASTDGLENNTANLLLDGWKGLWIEAELKHVNQIRERFQLVVENHQLTVNNAFVDAENIERLFKEANVPSEFDFLSIDIDGNDYWIWKAITKYRPRVVCIEYNAIHGDTRKWVMAYNPKHVWDGSNYYGASLKSYELLAREKGYSLVGCDFTGGNAFFVREDCVSNKFQQPFTSENHFEPIRCFLNRQVGQTKRRFGPFETI